MKLIAVVFWLYFSLQFCEVCYQCQVHNRLICYCKKSFLFSQGVPGHFRGVFLKTVWYELNHPFFEFQVVFL